MKPDQWFSLSWRNIGTKQNQIFNDLWQEGELIDVTIVCGEKNFYAHRIILSASSTYFRQSLKSLPTNSIAVVLLPTVHPDDLESLLRFIYCGEVSVQGSRFKSFLAAASDLKISGLCNENLDVNQTSQDLGTSKTYEDKELFQEPEIISLDSNGFDSNLENPVPEVESIDRRVLEDANLMIPKEEAVEEMIDFPQPWSQSIPCRTYRKNSRSSSIAENETSTTSSPLPSSPDIPMLGDNATNHPHDEADNLDYNLQEFNPLPQFSPTVLPYLEGRAVKHPTFYSSKVKDEVITHLRKYPSIFKANCQDRKRYLNEIGKCMKEQYPNMPWDPPPSQRKRTFQDAKYPWVYFMNKTLNRWSHIIQKNTLVDVMKSCRKAQLLQKAAHLSPAEALKRLNDIENRMCSGEQFETDEIESLLVTSFPLRKLNRNSSFPFYFRNQHILESEAILIFDQGLYDIEVQLYISVIKVKDRVQGESIFDVQNYLSPDSKKVLNMTSCDFTPIPGPTLYYNQTTKSSVIKYNDCEYVSIKGGILRATCLLLATYDILGLSYPPPYAQTLAFVEYCILKKCSLKDSLQTEGLKRLKSSI